MRSSMRRSQQGQSNTPRSDQVKAAACSWWLTGAAWLCRPKPIGQTTLMSAFPSSRRVNSWLHWKQWTSGVAGQGRRHDRHDDG